MRAVVIVLLAVLTASTEMARANEFQVAVESGKLIGLASRDSQVRSFKGIPYAAPPVGPLRWRPPQPPAAWDGEREAFRYSPACTQPSPQPGAFYQREFMPTALPRSEDCLYLNVWAPVRADTPRPVMVFIHPGGHRAWSGTMPQFDGTALARKDVVVVTFNYRLGPLGFLVHPGLDAENPNGVSGNYGLLDQFAVLRWVQANIAAFGGDPGRVTIFGQSSGGESVAFALTAPQAKGLFHRAIIQSSFLWISAGNVFSLATIADARKAVTRMAAELGADSIEALRAIPAQDLVDRVNARPSPAGVFPVIDGWVLPRDIGASIASGQYSPADLMIGTTANDVRSQLPPVAPDILRKRITERYGAQGEALAQLYQVGDDTATATTAQDRLGSDFWQAIARAVAGRFAQDGHRAWVYSFNRAAPGSDPVTVGAYHCIELTYLFGTLNVIDRPWENTDRELSETIASYWIRFAETGDPNGPNTAEWPAHVPGSQKRKEFGTHPAPDLREKSAPLLDAYLLTRIPEPKR